MKRVKATKLYEDKVQKLKNTLKLIQDIPFGTPLRISFRGVDYDSGEWEDHSCIGIALDDFSTQALRVELIASDDVYPVLRWPDDQPTKFLLKFCFINSYTIVPPSDLALALGYEYKTKLLADYLSGKVPLSGKEV